MFIFYIITLINLYFLNILNKLSFFLKCVKYDNIVIIFNIFTFNINYIISNNNI